MIKSPMGLNWRTPQSITVSTILNQYVPVTHEASRDPIGHVNVEYRCPKLNQLVITGSSGKNASDNRDRVLKLHYGLATMLSTSEGYLEGDEVRSDLDVYAENGRLSVFKILINDAACERIVRYMKEYRELSIDKIYGGVQSDPLKKEGAGCGTFGASFLEMLGYLTDSERSGWKRALGVPYRFIGGPIGGGRQVKLTRLLLAFGSRWTREGSDKGMWIDFYDPDLMYKWVWDEYERVLEDPASAPYPASTFEIKNAVGVTYDMRAITPLSGPIFKE
ncbi:MAG: hypothetical protein JST80_04285 [Bdellovibrionales bacterium]|nr:hypothetical protein [Bdellovibrionales bacterium]